MLKRQHQPKQRPPMRNRKFRIPHPLRNRILEQPANKRVLTDNPHQMMEQPRVIPRMRINPIDHPHRRQPAVPRQQLRRHPPRHELNRLIAREPPRQLVHLKRPRRLLKHHPRIPKRRILLRPLRVQLDQLPPKPRITSRVPIKHPHRPRHDLSARRELAIFNQRPPKHHPTKQPPRQIPIINRVFPITPRHRAQFDHPVRIIGRSHRAIHQRPDRPIPKFHGSQIRIDRLTAIPKPHVRIPKPNQNLCRLRRHPRDLLINRHRTRRIIIEHRRPCPHIPLSDLRQHRHFPPHRRRRNPSNRQSQHLIKRTNRITELRRPRRQSNQPTIHNPVRKRKAANRGLLLFAIDQPLKPALDRKPLKPTHIPRLLIVLVCRFRSRSPLHPRSTPRNRNQRNSQSRHGHRSKCSSSHACIPSLRHPLHQDPVSKATSHRSSLV